MNVVIVSPGHPSPRGKSFPPALTAPYLAALAAPHVDQIKIIDLAVEPFDLFAPIPDIAMFTFTMAQFDHVYRIAKYLKANGTKIFSARIIPLRGSWVEFTTDINDVLYVYIDRRKKFPVTTLLRALGYSTDNTCPARLCIIHHNFLLPVE